MCFKIDLSSIPRADRFLQGISCWRRLVWLGRIYSFPPKTGSRLRRRFSGAYQFPVLPGSPWQQRFLPRAGQLTIHAAPRPVHRSTSRTGKYERCAIQIQNSVENLCLEMYLYCSIELFKLHNSRQRKVDEVVMVEMHTGVFWPRDWWEAPGALRPPELNCFQEYPRYIIVASKQGPVQSTFQKYTIWYLVAFL